VQASLAALESAARGSDNLMPYILDAVTAYATLGEISDVFRNVFGKHLETVVL
jgi:methylmalonyl-CoA mutase N-terminal domain/subunit